MFITVPRLFNKIYDNINIKTNKSWIFKYAFNIKLNKLKNGYGFNHIFWDTFVFNKIKNVLGGNVVEMITGSAPLSDNILDFLRAAFCCDIHQGIFNS